MRISGQSSVTDDDDDMLANIPPGQGGLIKNPAKNDVLSGRGGRVNAHEGNIRFRNLVGELKHEYVAKSTKKLDKAHIASKIVKLIRKMNPPGRFLKVDGESKLWIEIGDDKARKKAGQALREDAPEVRSGLDKEKDEVEQKEQVKKLLETMATQMPYGFPPGYFPNIPMANMTNMANPYAMAAPFNAANMVGGPAPIYPAQTLMMQPDAAAAAMFYQQQQAQASAAFNPYGVFQPAMGQQPQAFVQQPAAAAPDTQSPVKTNPPPESITMPTIPKIPGIPPSNPNPPKAASNDSNIIAPFGNVPSHSFAALTNTNERAIQPPETTKSALWGASREQYRSGNSDLDDEDEDEDDIDDESEQKTENEDMSLVSQMQNSHVSEPSEKEENIWASSRKGQWLGGKRTGGGDSAVGSSAVGSAVTPNTTNVTSTKTKHPEQVVVKHRNDRDIFDTSNQHLPRVLEEENADKPDKEDVFDGVSMKSVNTFNCSEMNDLVSLSGNSFQALMNGDDFSVSQRSIISELSSDLLSLDTKHQQNIYAEAVRQVNVQYQSFFHKPMDPVEHQQAQQMYFEAVKNTHAQMLAQSRK